MAVSRAHASWSGDLMSGAGAVSSQSTAFKDLGLTWKARTERSEGTSPEELIAAAHAGCYAMALSGTLARAGSPAERLEVDAQVHFTPVEGGGFAISRVELTVTGTVPGIDADRFEELAADGERGCPVSNALRGNVEILLEAVLA